MGTRYDERDFNERLIDVLERIATALEEQTTLLVEPDKSQEQTDARPVLEVIHRERSQDQTLWDLPFVQHMERLHVVSCCLCWTCRQWNELLNRTIHEAITKTGKKK